VTGATIEVTCDSCRAWQKQSVDVVLVTEQDDAVVLLWPCVKCLAGVQRLTHPADRAVALASGAGIRRSGQSGWPTNTLLGAPPVWPMSRPPRPTPLTRLARLVGRRFTSNPDR